MNTSSINLDTCSLTRYVGVKHKQTESKLSCEREITISCNFLLNNHHPSDLKQKKFIKKLNLAGFEPTTPCPITTALSTGIPNSQPISQLTTERFDIHRL